MQQDLEFPPMPAAESRFWLCLRGYIHEIVLIPISRLYCKLTGQRPEHCILPLPFNLVLKCVYVDDTRVQEVIGTKCARAIGLPVPRIISFGEHPNTRLFSLTPVKGFGSILMTRVPGENLNVIHDSLSPEELASIMEELERFIMKMRQYRSPWGNRICSVNGGRLRGPSVPNVPSVRLNNERDFVDLYVKCANPLLWRGKVSFEDALASVRRLKDASHPIVFTHGDLMPQNIMIKDGHISGFVDWDYASWLPDYWEYCEMLRSPSMKWWWPKLVVDMHSFKYGRELDCYRCACALASESFDYH